MNKRDAKTLAEASAAIKRLQATLNQGDNRFGEYGRNCRDAIQRWEDTVEEILRRNKREP